MSEPAAGVVLNSTIARAVTLLDKVLTNEESKIYALVEVVARELEYPWSDDAFVSLYQRLFITQAALCELYFIYEAREDKRVVLTPVSASLQDAIVSPPNSGKTVLVSREEGYLPNFDFYQNERNYLDIDAEQVKTLLTRFWTQYDRYMNRHSALAILGLDEGAEWQDIKRRFRELASDHHPDKGGDSARFVDLRRAYESLKRSL